MRQLVLTFLFAFGMLVSNAQFSVETTDYQGVVPLTSFTDHQISIYNELGDSLDLGWKYVDNTCPMEWTYSLCDFGHCYEGIPLSGTMQPVPGTADAFMKLSVWANEVEGQGSITFWVYEVSTPLDYTEITFWFNMTPQTVAEPLSGMDVLVYPNPATDVVTVTSAAPASYTLFDASGQRVLDGGAPSVSWTLDVRDLPEGWYAVQSKSMVGIATHSILIQH